MPQRSPQPEGPDNESKSSRLAQDIDGLHKEIRQDFDQRIHDLSTLMGRFKALMSSDSRAQQRDGSAKQQNQAADSSKRPAGKTIQRRIPIPPPANASKGGSSTSNKDNSGQAGASSPSAGTGYQPARFETGLYQLASQLQRFRLELDQELEFRQQPLHVHFRQQSELARSLQQISLDKQEKDDGK